MLHIHNVIEHDGSLSRRDEYFDPTNPFDKTTFDSFLSYFGNAQMLDVGSLANARARHALDMSKINPEFTITQETMQRILGENALMLAVWGSPDNPVAKRPYF
ncbi:hypothetical protein CPLU01_13134 [Colletotrichum plurivorum]|uniref:Heme haloperoxidase family profile domain-containing protein n=1 Tax=Colletotrichum plurivorum TaxID=2175906 RepID=A0A8H6JUZ6_9PEZI|nr:hypothetical protein CPLU01_13134 [Colletotrichum plurivorum]